MLGISLILNHFDLIFYFLAVIAMKNGVVMAKKCYAFREGQCLLEACASWCYQTYKGQGNCMQESGDPFHPSFKCSCNYICST